MSHPDTWFHLLSEYAEREAHHIQSVGEKMIINPSPIDDLPSSSAH